MGAPLRTPNYMRVAQPIVEAGWIVRRDFEAAREQKLHCNVRRHRLRRGNEDEAFRAVAKAEGAGAGRTCEQETGNRCAVAKVDGGDPPRNDRRLAAEGFQGWRALNGFLGAR